VVIKRKKVVVAGGHHGGAWKVAYADFVTAMMAFFMLMWLLNATTEKQRKGISDYFNPTIPINRISGGGDGAFGGDSVFAEDTMARNGTGGSDLKVSDEKKSRGDSGVSDSGSGEEGELEKIADMLRGKSGDSESRELLLKHLVTKVTDEGLIVEIFERDGAALFSAETAEPTQLLRDLVAMISQVYAMTRNSVAINGHVRSYPLVLAENPMWSLTTARGMAVRDLMEQDGFARERLQRVTGFADRQPATANRSEVRNNRMELVLLRSRT
jgi:chemotaxis protein MotB